MGFNTVAVLYNDFQGDLEKDGAYGRRIAEAMRDWWDQRHPAATSFGAGAVISQAHADYSQVVIVARNSGVPADKADDLDWAALEQMQRCLERHGYKVTKPRKRKPAAQDTALSRDGRGE